MPAPQFGRRTTVHPRVKGKMTMCGKKKQHTLASASDACQGKKMFFYDCPHCNAYHLTKVTPEQWAAHLARTA
jgi:hypothetical protein